MSVSKQINQCQVRLEIGDITDFEVEVFVFYARKDLKLGTGFGNAITMRGGPSIQKELDEFGTAEVANVFITEAGNMKAKHIIHAVGPKFQEPDIEEKLASTVTNALKKATEKGFKQIAFPAMGAGFYGIPLPDCARIMFENIGNYLQNSSDFKEIVVRVLDNREYQPFLTEFENLN
ncbi:O-acetyl-ADP-ribose deacetylase [candidate division LCP-89 bacterium B3_LCP]|uniref:O-acetyl-ADP-ribose deacetylase n=1 Tax=candidate division LCP-89 bacterium B3_LCP TaxID=2012998 RepID=A0A532UQR7_UNCL8|nr:MAG: O-acetyl-ADP-ribose deacetylase [candidate division LCP-89 bacterium B3_LCP]